ncbi:MAG: endolytic transglycosylase MltG [Halanaerobiaceae bacterium]
MKRAGITFFLLVLVLALFLRINYLVGPVSRMEESAETKTIFISSGTGTREIADKLHFHGLITSPLLFNITCKITGLDNQIQAGYYELSTRESMWDHIQALTSGQIATFRVTIPEGFTVEDVAERLAEKTVYGRDDFLKVAREKSFENYFLPGHPSGGVRYHLEGYIYPDTYLIPRQFEADEMMGVFLSEFNEKWGSILPEKSADREFNPFEILTIASLVEKEARFDREKPLIAGVIYNRLDRDMHLQIDASVRYGLRLDRKQVLYRDLKEDNPYNTYLFYDLPPGPIGNPGDGALEAALNPEDTDYLYYFARDNGEHVFSETYEQHLERQQDILEGEEQQIETIDPVEPLTEQEEN